MLFPSRMPAAEEAQLGAFSASLGHQAFTTASDPQSSFGKSNVWDLVLKTTGTCDHKQDSSSTRNLLSPSHCSPQTRVYLLLASDLPAETDMHFTVDKLGGKPYKILLVRMFLPIPVERYQWRAVSAC